MLRKFERFTSQVPAHCHPPRLSPHGPDACQELIGGKWGAREMDVEHPQTNTSWPIRSGILKRIRLLHHQLNFLFFQYCPGGGLLGEILRVRQ